MKETVEEDKETEEKEANWRDIKGRREESERKRIRRE